MKNDFDLFALAVIVVCTSAVCALTATIWGISERSENKRLYQKCLLEHEVLPHKDAVDLCKERVK